MVILASEMSALEWAQFATLVAAGLFFLAKARDGYFVVNLTLDVSLDRRRSSDSEDVLVVLASLEKGGAGSVRIEEVAARCECGTDTSTAGFRGVERLDRPPNGPRLSEDPDAWSVASDRPLRLAIGETMSVSCWFPVPTGTICSVDVAVIGRARARGRPPQWRASRISLPI